MSANLNECLSKPKAVCVIGAGLSGLVSLKCLLDAGFDVTCFEINKHVGGRWHEENENPIPRTTVTNLPKYMSCYSDFPLPDEYPLYMSAQQYSKYFETYAENFHLLKNIKFQHEVLHADPIESNPQNEARWKVTFIDKLHSEEHTQEFDLLVVASGFYSLPYVPDRIASVVRDFKGVTMHSIDYKDAESFKDKTVVVCGLGNTGGDIAVESSRFAKKTIISTSHGSYVLGRLIYNGNVPLDVSLKRITSYIPGFIKKFFLENVIRNFSNHVADINRWNLKPKSLLSTIVNDEILHQISYGKIQVRKGIEKIEGRTVHFTDGKIIDNVDVLVLCTGYFRKFPFLDENIICPQRESKFLPLYKGVFPINLSKSLGFVGMFLISNSFAVTSEMQARFIAERFRGNIKLPNPDAMRREIDSYVKDTDKKFSGNVRELNMISDPWKYYNTLADDIGCRPSLLKILLTDPLLFWHLSTRYSFHEFRLTGPNKWNGARDAIINQEKSTYDFFDT